MKRIMWLNFLVVLLFSVVVQNSFAESDPTLDNFINITRKLDFVIKFKLKNYLCLIIPKVKSRFARKPI